MPEQYYNNHHLIQEAASMLSGVGVEGDELSLAVPALLQDIITQEAFYCRAQDTDMPSRMILHGLSILALARRGAMVCFEVEGDPSTHSREPSRRLPFLYPLPETAEAVKLAMSSMGDLSASESEVILSPATATLLHGQSEQNGASLQDNFVAFAGLINYVGTNERVGQRLAVRVPQDLAAV